MSHHHEPALGSEKDYRCVTQLQLRFNDIDVLGHVNNSVYFQLFDLAKTDYFTRIRPELTKWQHVPMVIAGTRCNFLSPTRFTDTIAARTRLLSFGTKSFTLAQQIFDTRTGEVKAECEQVMVYIDLATGSTAPVPDDWRADMTAYDATL